MKTQKEFIEELKKEILIEWQLAEKAKRKGRTNDYNYINAFADGLFYVYKKLCETTEN